MCNYIIILDYTRRARVAPKGSYCAVSKKTQSTTGKFGGNDSIRRIQSSMTGKFVGNAPNRRIQCKLTGKFVGNNSNRRIQYTLKILDPF